MLLALRKTQATYEVYDLDSTNETIVANFDHHWEAVHFMKKREKVDYVRAY